MMNNFEFRNLIDSIKNSVDIVEIIGERITLDKHYKALCPFHDETKPSFSVNQREQYFYCFGCKKGGDVIQFLMDYDRLTFWEALTELAKRAGIPLPNSEFDQKEIENNRKVGDILNETVKFYTSHIPPEVKGYLINQRGLTDETILKYRIGYANWNLKEHLVEKCKFDVDSCIESGVLKIKEDGKVSEFFYKRIILPTMWRGRVVYLSGRAHGDHQPKYLHLPGEKKYFYNEEALYEKEVHVTEGIFDCLSMIQKGYPCVAIQGKNLKVGDEDKFSRCVKVYICFDGDEGGKIGTLEIAKTLGLKAKIVQFPDGIDPNDYFLSQAKEDFELLKASALDYFGYQIKSIPKDISRTDLYQRIEIILNELAEQADPYIDAVFQEHIKPRFGFTEKDLDSYRKLIKQHKKDDRKNHKQSGNKNIPIEMTARFDGLVDIVESDGESAFLIKNDDELIISREYEKDGKLYIPPSKSQIEWLLSDANNVLEHYNSYESESSKSSFYGSLYDEIRNYLKNASELPREDHYDLLTNWVLHTYLLENLQYSPIISLYAYANRGKSRTGKALIHLAYRGIHVETLRPAYIFRMAEDWNVSIFFDVRNLMQVSEKEGSLDIITHRYERGAKVMRVLHPEKKAYDGIAGYVIFGPTITAINKPVDQILESRGVTINMRLTSKIFENDILPSDALPLKEKLTAFRAMIYDKPLMNIKKPSPTRLGDILKPLFQISNLVKPEKADSLISLVRKIEEDRKLENSETREAQIIQIVHSLKYLVKGGYLPIKEITNAFNKGKKDRFKINEKTIGHSTKKMGFEKKRLGDGATGILWDEKLILRTMEYLGIEKTSESSESSENETPKKNHTDISEVSELYQDSRRTFFDDIPHSDQIN